MRILIVEDAEDKRSRLLEFLSVECPEAVVSVDRSLQSGIRTALRETPDLILLDMSMPTFDITQIESGGRHKHFAGREFLEHLDRRDLRVPVIVVTQFDAFGDPPAERTLDGLTRELKAAHPSTFIGSVYYHPTSDAWKSHLQSLMASASRNRL